MMLVITDSFTAPVRSSLLAHERVNFNAIAVRMTII